MMIRTAWVLAHKDLVLYFRDRTALLLSIALPLFLATIFSAAMGTMGGQDSIGRVKLYVEDLDGSERSQALVKELETTKGLTVKRESNVRKRVADGKGPAALLIPAGYGADVASGRSPRLLLYRDPGQEIEQQIVAGNLMPALFKANGRDMGRAMMKRSLKAFGFPEAGMAQAEKILETAWSSVESVATDSSPTTSSKAEDAVAGGSNDFLDKATKLMGLEVEDVAGGEDPNAKAAGSSHAISGIAVMMLLFGVTAAGGTILEEQSAGTLLRLQLTPNAGPAILLGKFVFILLCALLQLAILFAYGGLVFDVPVLRAPVALVILSVALACAATGLGLVFAVTCRSRKQLEGLSTLVILAMSALGGSWFPLIITPEWYRKLGHFTLNAWAMDGFQGLFWYGKDLMGIWLEITVLLAIAAATTLLAWRGWKRRFEIAT